MPVLQRIEIRKDLEGLSVYYLEHIMMVGTRVGVVITRTLVLSSKMEEVVHLGE